MTVLVKSQRNLGDRLHCFFTNSLGRTESPGGKNRQMGEKNKALLALHSWNGTQVDDKAGRDGTESSRLKGAALSRFPEALSRQDTTGQTAEATQSFRGHWFQEYLGRPPDRGQTFD